MREAIAKALAGQATIVFARDSGAVNELRTAARDGATVLMVLDETVPKLDAAMLIAALGPLAEEMAPDTRIVALDIGTEAGIEDVVAAALYLASAMSTTGQILRITAS